jgi:Domain of unknown function (DUF4398)
MANAFHGRPLTALFALGALAACAHENVPESQLSRAQVAYDRAVAAQAGARSPAELARAQTELQGARAAIDKEDYTQARRLADQAEADARLAESRAQAATEAENLAQLKGTVDKLQQTAVPAPAAP